VMVSVPPRLGWPAAAAGVLALPVEVVAPGATGVAGGTPGLLPEHATNSDVNPAPIPS
jgi:hypothetical protein